MGIMVLAIMRCDASEMTAIRHAHLSLDATPTVELYVVCERTAVVFKMTCQLMSPGRLLLQVYKGVLLLVLPPCLKASL